jgi:hypothetical protein
MLLDFENVKIARARTTVFCGGQPLNSLTIAFVLILPFPAAAFARESPKLSADQYSLLEDTRAYALQYIKQLPNFVCTQITHRDVSSHMPNGTAYTLDASSDTIEEQLTYVDGKEAYTVLTLNGEKAPEAAHSQLDGAISWGEFGSLLSQVFDPASHTIFSWDREVRVNGRRGWAFKYQVPKESGTTVVDQPSNQAVVVSYSGRIVIDPETNDVLEISSVLDIPATFRIRDVTRTVLYGDQDIAGKKFCLPLHSELHMQEGTRIFDNRIDFKDYHRFSSNSTIHFDPPPHQ